MLINVDWKVNGCITSKFITSDCRSCHCSMIIVFYFLLFFILLNCKINIDQNSARRDTSSFPHIAHTWKWINEANNIHCAHTLVRTSELTYTQCNISKEWMNTCAVCARQHGLTNKWYNRDYGLSSIWFFIHIFISTFITRLLSSVIYVPICGRCACSCG